MNMQNDKYRAYVAVKTEPRTTKETFRKLSDTRCVKQAHMVAGCHDILLLLEGGTQKELFDTVLGEIRSYPGIVRTETWPVFE